MPEYANFPLINPDQRQACSHPTLITEMLPVSDSCHCQVASLAGTLIAAAAEA